MIDGINKALNWNWSPSQWAAAQARYDRYIVEQHGKIRIFGQTTPKSLTSIFTDVYVLDAPTAHSYFEEKEVAEYLRNESRSRSFRHGERKPVEGLLSQGTKFIILGKPGAGKTTLLRHLALREAQPGRLGHHLGKVPIFVSLKQYANARKPLSDFIVQQFEVCRFPDAAPYIGEMLESGSVLVLFDGLDEVMDGEETQPTQRGLVAEELEQFALRYSDCHVVISTRIAAINYTFHPTFTYLELADFAPDQVQQFVRHWFMDEAKPDESTAQGDRMLDELAKHEHEGIRDLARSPLLLTLLCLNYAKTGRFPVKRAEVYDEALDALLKTWDETRQIGRGTRYKALSLGRKRQMFAAIAYDAFTRGQIVFPQADLVSWLVAHMEHVPGLPDSIDIDGEAILQEIIAQHGIFAQQAHRLYSFSHLTFQEYFTAKYIADDKSADSMMTLLEHITDSRWIEVTLMTASLLPAATDFLEGFAAGLMQLATSYPDLAKVLRLLGEQVAGSQSKYRHLAIRLLCLFGALAFLHPIMSIDRDLDRDLDRDRLLARERTLTLALELDCTLALDLALDGFRYFDRDLGPLRYLGRFLDLDRTLAQSLAHNLDFDLERTRSLALALDCGHDRDHFLDLDCARALARALATYLFGTRLFYDCIQLAYTPDRRAFEDRILEPPPR